MTNELEALALRCEQAEGPDRVLDCAIWYALQHLMEGDPVHGPLFSASLDAALSLVPEDEQWLVEHYPWSGHPSGKSCAQVGNRSPVKTGRIVAPTHALALTAAALRARAAQ